MDRVRIISSKLPNTWYYCVLPVPVPHTDTDTGTQWSTVL